jgi:putative acyl-CoA dehydrogenase
MPHTHEVTNQVPPLTSDISTFPALLEGLHREGAGWAEPEVRELGQLANSHSVQEWGRLANEHPPVLRTHDRYGNRIDEVDYLPQYHELMRQAVEYGMHGAPWTD